MTNWRANRNGVDLIVQIGKAIDHPLRVRALAALGERELCVCELIELFGLAPSTISKHMSVIADAGLVHRRRDGQWTYYSLPADPEPPVARVIALVTSLAAEDKTVREDLTHIPKIHCSAEK